MYVVKFLPIKTCTQSTFEYKSILEKHTKQFFLSTLSDLLYALKDARIIANETILIPSFSLI